MIYKREPIQHTLPTGWNDMDAVKYTVLNRIKGIQHINNPIVSDQESTYDCKNVFQDASGNLTVRPALRCLRVITETSNILGIYKTTIGELVHYEKDGIYKIQDEAGVFEVIGEGDIAIQESDFNTYILYTDVQGNLSFKQWDNGFVDIDPAIPVNSPTAPVARRYNLLTDKTKYEAAPVNLDDPDNWVNFEYEDNIDPSEAFAISNSLVIDYDLTLANNDGEDNTIRVVHYTRYGTAWQKAEFEVYINSSELRESAIYYKNRSFMVPTRDFDGEDAYVYYVLEGAPFDGTRHYLITVKLTGTPAATIAEFVINIEFDENPQPSMYPIKDALIVFGTHGGIDDLRKYTPGTDRFTTVNITSSNFLQISQPSAHGILVVEALMEDYYYYNFDTGTVTRPALKPSIISSGALVLPTENYILIVYDKEIQAIDSNGVVINLPGIHVNKSGVRARYGFADTVTLWDTDGKYFVTNFSDTKQYDAAVPIIAIDGSLGIGIDKFLYREPKPNYIEAVRDISDSFPVLSQIEDNVLTSFYLDNVYWFVTEHRVFGTGVADEEFTIKYFDPMKYFHFDEKLTGAIRVSDSGFWVFHENGAYLIYKSTTSIYDQATGEYVEVLAWLCTSTAKSKGCDFKNAVVTLPVTNYVSCVTSSDISIIQMYENVQTDDRILMPMTLNFQKFIANLLEHTESIVTGVYKYSALYFLNPAREVSKVPVMVYDSAAESWWYWELPVSKVVQVITTETGPRILALLSTGQYVEYDLFEDYYDYRIGGLTYSVYADRLLDNQPTLIEWFWESAVLHFGSVDYKKQLLKTSFTMSDADSTTITFDYNFEVYNDAYSEQTWTPVDKVVERIHTFSYKNIIASFAYLQLYLKNTDAKEYDFTAYTRPKFSTISFKYRVLSGG